MKRSEMINIILNSLLENSDGFVKPGVIGFSTTTYYEPHREDRLRKAAGALLTEIENEGMKPPCSAGFGGHGHLNNDGDCDDYIESCSFKWEDEPSEDLKKLTKVKQYLKEMTEIAIKYNSIISEPIEVANETYDPKKGDKLYWDSKLKQYVAMTPKGLVTIND